MKKILLIVFLLISASSNLYATHFRYGHISWTRQPNTRIVTFKVTVVWRIDYGDPNFEDIALNFGDGTTDIGRQLTILYQGAGVKVGELTVQKTYLTDGPFTVYFQNCCRISTLQGGAADEYFKIASTVCLIGNNIGSPINLSPQILKLPILSNSQLRLNATDSDGSSVTFSQATIAGAGYSYTPPTVGGNALSLSSTGVVSWNTSGATVGQLYVLRVKFSDGCAESEADYIVEIVSGTCSVCTDKVLTDFTDNDRFCAAQFLCNNLVIKAQQPNPKGNLIRGDLANVSYRALIGESFNTIANYFPCPFVDLQTNDASNTEYFKHAKTLSYLEYGDGRAPFDRNLINFNPSDTITRALVLKVLLESWNINEDITTGTLPFSDVTTTHPQYKYILKAYNLGIVTGTGGLFKPNTRCTREDAFLMLYRLMTNTTITKPTLAQINAGFFIPNIFRPETIGMGAGVDRGNFNHYTKTSFALDGLVPLVFAHSYNSYTTELPDELFPNYLGRGWTHSFNCYITSLGSAPNARIIVHYPDGTLHYYKGSGTNWTPETLGVYDTFSPSTDGLTITITTPNKIVYTFGKVTGASGNYYLIKTIKDRNNNTLTFTNEVGVNTIPRVKSVADPAGRILNFTYLTGENYLKQVSLSGVGTFNGRNVQFTYDTPPNGFNDKFRNLASYKEYDINASLKTTTYGYFTPSDSSLHLLKTIALPKGNVIDNTYQQRKLKSSRTMNGTTVVQKMDVNLTPSYTTTSTTSSSSVSTFDGSITKRTNYVHNKNGLPTSVATSGANNVQMGMSYNNSNDPTAVTALKEKSMTTDSVRITYATTTPFNPLTVTIVGPSGPITQTYTYNTFNDVLTHKNGRNFTTTFEYNATGNLTKVIHPIGNPTVLVRKTNGLVEKVTSPASVVSTFVYNSYGNLTSTTIANGTNPAIVTSAVYDALSRVTSTTDARNNATNYTYWANDLLKKTTAPLSYTMDYTYDANDNNTSIINAKGNATTMSYHPQTDQLMSRSFAGKTESFTYYGDGALKTYTNKRGNVFTFTYDESGRVKNDSYSTYSYNTDGTVNTISHTQTTGSKTYVLDYDYDILKRVSKTTCDGFGVQYQYDNNNNLIKVIYPDGKTVTYTYDAKDRITTVTDWAGRVTTYTLDNDGKVLNYVLPNTTKAVYTYDAAGRPKGISNQKSAGTIISSYTFTLDQAGNHTEENLIEPFDPSPMQVGGTTSYTNNAANQTTAAGTNTYVFDGNGAENNQAGQALTYDTRDNVLTAYGKTFFYDGNETRRAKTGKRYVMNELSNSVIAETNDAGTYLYYYVYGPTGLLYRQNASTGAVEYYHYDFRGSTIAMTDASQNIVRSYQYDAYGKIVQQNPLATTDNNPFRYVGQHGVQYEEANLYFMRARYYDPTTGKFLSEDPIWNTNLYAYADNNPVMNIDPSGLQVAETATVGVTTVVAATVGLYLLYKISQGLVRTISNVDVENISLSQIPKDLNITAVYELKATTDGTYIGCNFLPYELKKGDTYKFGETSRSDRYNIFFVGSDAFAQYKNRGKDWLNTTTFFEILGFHLTKRDARAQETWLIQNHKNNNNGLRPPGNCSDH